MKSDWIPSCEAVKNQKDFGSWIDVHKIPRTRGHHERIVDHTHTVTSEKITNCQKIIIYPKTDKIPGILNWMEASRIMYNFTIDVLNEVIFDENNKIVKNYEQFLKLGYLRPQIQGMKEEIKEFFGDMPPPVHSLDQASLKCASMFLSSIKNHERREGIAKFIAKKKEEARKAKKLKEKCQVKAKTTKAKSKTSKVKSKTSKANSKTTKAKPKIRKANSKTNKKNENQIPDRPFVMKPIGPNERNKWMIIECGSFQLHYNTFCVSQLGKLKTSTKISRARTSNFIFDTCIKRFTLFLPNDIQSKKFTTRNLTCGIDPGIKTFLTVYSENECYEIGHEIDFEKHFNKASVYHSLRKMRHYTKAQYKKKLAKHNDKLKRKVKDMQFKIAKMLCEKYSVIKIGVLKVQSIMKRKDISAKDKRKLSTLSHYKFRQILKYQGEKYGCDVQEVNEYMTTKTCSACGHTYNVGKSRVYECKNRKCKLIADRDINAAKNIRYKDPNPKKKKRKKRSRYPKRKPKPTDVQK